MIVFRVPFLGIARVTGPKIGFRPDGLNRPRPHAGRHIPMTERSKVLFTRRGSESNL